MVKNPLWAKKMASGKKTNVDVASSIMIHSQKLAKMTTMHGNIQKLEAHDSPNWELF